MVEDIVANNLETVTFVNSEGQQVYNYNHLLLISSV